MARYVCKALIQMSNDSLIVNYGDSVGQHFQDVARESRMILEVPHAVLTFIYVMTNESIVSWPRYSRTVVAPPLARSHRSGICDPCPNDELLVTSVESTNASVVAT
jgi:hypothetical protein